MPTGWINSCQWDVIQIIIYRQKLTGGILEVCVYCDEKIMMKLDSRLV